MVTLFSSLLLFISGCFENSSKIEVGNSIEAIEHPITQDSLILCTGWYYVRDNNNGVLRQLDKSNESYFIDPKPIVTAKNFITLEIYKGKGGSAKHIGLAMYLDEAGTKNWSIATENAIEKKLAFILDNRLLQVAKVNSRISSGTTALNRRNYSRAELKKFKAIIKSQK